MAYETKFDGSTDSTIKIGADNNPTTLEGYFLGTKTIPSQTKGFKDSSLHIFQTPDGVIGAWGTTYLDRLLTEDLKGMKCLVEFTGMIAPKKRGQRPAYGYKVQFDRGDMISIDHVNLNAPKREALESDDGGGEDEDTSFETETFEEPPKRQVSDRRAMTPKPAGLVARSR